MTAEERDTYASSASRLYQKSDDTAATIVAADSIDGEASEKNTAIPDERSPSSLSSTTSHLAPIKTGEVLPPGEGDMKEVEKQDTVFSIHDPRAFPDGGYHAWLCVVGAFFATLSSFGVSIGNY